MMACIAATIAVAKGLPFLNEPAATRVCRQEYGVWANDIQVLYWDILGARWRMRQIAWSAP
jgi:hypothetical protein